VRCGCEVEEVNAVSFKEGRGIGQKKRGAEQEERVTPSSALHKLFTSRPLRTVASASTFAPSKLSRSVSVT